MASGVKKKDLKDGGGQGLIPVVGFSSKCHLGAHAVAKSVSIPQFLPFQPSVLKHQRSVSHIGLFHPSVAHISEEIWFRPPARLCLDACF